MPNPILQLRLIQAFPAASHRCHRVRRKLALAFALSDKQLLEADLEDPFLFDRVSRHLSHLTRTAHSADHAALGATIELLDIGVDAGFSNRNFTIDQHAEKSFNKRVSELAKAVKELDSRLIGSGLSSLSKHTTKATLDRLGGRLQYAVRTKPPAKSGFLGPTAEEEERTVKWMSKWVNKEKDGPVKKDDVLLKQNVQAGDPTKAEELESTETLQLRPACFGVHLTPAG